MATRKKNTNLRDLSSPRGSERRKIKKTKITSTILDLLKPEFFFSEIAMLLMPYIFDLKEIFLRKPAMIDEDIPSTMDGTIQLMRYLQLNSEKEDLPERFREAISTCKLDWMLKDGPSRKVILPSDLTRTTKDELLELIQQAKSSEIEKEKARLILLKLAKDVTLDRVNFPYYHFLSEGSLWLLEDGALGLHFLALNQKYNSSIQSICYLQNSASEYLKKNPEAPAHIRLYVKMVETYFEITKITE